MGLWHEIESYPSVFQTGTCNNAYYSLDLTTAIVDVFNTQVINQQLDTINGSAVIADDAAGTGKLVVTFPIADTDRKYDSNIIKLKLRVYCFGIELYGTTRFVTLHFYDTSCTGSALLRCRGINIHTYSQKPFVP